MSAFYLPKFLVGDLVVFVSFFESYASQPGHGAGWRAVAEVESRVTSRFYSTADRTIASVLVGTLQALVI